MVRSVTASAASESIRVRVEVIVEPATPTEEQAEWEVIEPPNPVLEPALRDRLASRLSSRHASKDPKARVSAAWEAGVASRHLDLANEDLVRPPSLGIQNSCWRGIRPDFSGWVASKKRAADRTLRQEQRTRLVAFASQAEAEAYCIGLGLGGLPKAI